MLSYLDYMGKKKKTGKKNLRIFFMSVVCAGLPFFADAQERFTSAPRLAQVVARFMHLLLNIVGIAGIIAFVISGLIYLTSAGSPDQAEKAKRALFYAIAGLIVGIGSFIIVATVNMLLS